MSYHNEPPLIGESLRIRLPKRDAVAFVPNSGHAATVGEDKPIPTWPDLAYWRELAEQRERDLDAARVMIRELSRRPPPEEWNALITELRRRGWPGPAPALPAPDSKPAPFPARALRAKQWGPR